MPIEITLTGIGPRGDPGPEGIQGPQGGIAAYTHIQEVPTDVWVITHGLEFYPSITVVDSAGTIVEGHVIYADLATITVSFSVPFAGVAYMS